MATTTRWTSRRSTAWATGDGSGHPVDHIATLVNPGVGRKVNIGGEGETHEQGFEDFVTDPGVVGGPLRPLTDTVASDTATYIALRSAPVSTRGEREIRRIAASGARLTIATNAFTLLKTEQIVQRLGGVVSNASPRRTPRSLTDSAIRSWLSYSRSSCAAEGFASRHSDRRVSGPWAGSAGAQVFPLRNAPDR